MHNKPNVGYVCFGEINTPYERLKIGHDHALSLLRNLDVEVVDAGIVIDDPQYGTADEAIAKLKSSTFESLVICLAGWIPTHAVIRVTDVFRHAPMLLWGLCGWYEGKKMVTAAGQAGTTALRPAMEEMGYRFKYVYNVIGEPEPMDSIASFLFAAFAAERLRSAHIGTMGYRDMLLYGTQFEGNSMRSQLGVEVEPFEMLEMVQNVEQISPAEVKGGIDFIRQNWTFQKECSDNLLATGVKYALAVGKKIKQRGYEAITLTDVDGMKKLLGFPPAMVFMLLDHFYGVVTTPENDVMGNVTQLMLKYLSGQNAHYMEYYEFFKTSMLIGVPDYVPAGAVDGDIQVTPTAFGLLAESLLNVSKVKTGYVTCARLIWKKGRYVMHFYTGEARTPTSWAEFGWDDPAPQLPSLEVFPDCCSVPEFSRKVSSQHVIVCYGNYREQLEDLCALLDIEVI